MSEESLKNTIQQKQYKEEKKNMVDLVETEEKAMQKD
jgi:hypothetical protein